MKTREGAKWIGDYFAGKGTQIFKDGSTYYGDFVDRLPNGKGTMIYQDGTSYNGQFVNGKFEGEGIMKF